MISHDYLGLSVELISNLPPDVGFAPRRAAVVTSVHNRRLVLFHLGENEGFQNVTGTTGKRRNC